MYSFLFFPSSRSCKSDWRKLSIVVEKEASFRRRLRRCRHLVKLLRVWNEDREHFIAIKMDISLPVISLPFRFFNLSEYVTEGSKIKYLFVLWWMTVNYKNRWWKDILVLCMEAEGYQRVLWYQYTSYTEKFLVVTSTLQ